MLYVLIQMLLQKIPENVQKIPENLHLMKKMFSSVRKCAMLQPKGGDRV